MDNPVYHSIENPVAKELFKLFYEEQTKLLNEMEVITVEEYAIRQLAIDWIKYKYQEIEGCYFLATYDYSKVNKVYGQSYWNLVEKFNPFAGFIKQKKKGFFHRLLEYFKL